MNSLNQFSSLVILLLMMSCFEKPSKVDLAGADNDLDGIRDDVQEFIEKSSYPIELKQAHKQNAKCKMQNAKIMQQLLIEIK